MRLSSHVSRLAVFAAAAVVMVVTWSSAPATTSATSHDTVVPSQPTGLGTEAGDTQVKLTWDDPDNDSITEYELWQLIDSLKLTVGSRSGGDQFGLSVALDGDTLVIGASGEDPFGIPNAGLAFVFTREADGWSSPASLGASVRKSNARFGRSVAVHGDTVVVGAYQDDSNEAPAAGTAYVFTKPATGWANTMGQKKLEASKGKRDDDFGESVAVHGDTVVVGAPETGSSKGSAYVFTKPATGWANGYRTEQARFAGSSDGDRFGRSVAIDGDTVVVGAQDVDESITVTNSGAAYMFIKPGTGWANTTSASDSSAKLTAPDPALGDRFGRSVAMDGDTVVVGASGDDDGGTDSGSAYVFVKPATEGGWTDAITETAKLTASDAATDDKFGRSVAVDGDTVVVGAEQDYDSGDGSGSAYVFTKPVGGWTNSTESDKIVAYDGEGGDGFGQSVAVDDSIIVVGAGKDDSNRGAAYAFGTGADWADAPANGPTWNDIASSDADTMSHIVTGLNNNVKYTFRVRAVNGLGESDATDTVSATPTAADAAPGAPGNLSVGQTAADEVTLRWDPPSSPLTVTGYQYNQDGAIDWPDIDGSDSNTVSHKVGGLTLDSTYTFGVLAVNSAGEGPSSATVSITMVGFSAPTNAPENLSVDQTGNGEVTLAWDTVTSPLPVTGYEYNQDGGTDWGTIDESVSGPNRVSGTVIGLAVRAAPYTFAVRAVNNAGGGTASSAVSVTIVSWSAPATPANFAVEQTGDGVVSLEWDEVVSDLPVTGYQSTHDDGANWVNVDNVTTVEGSDPTRLSGNVADLDEGTEYTFAIRAVNAAGEGTASTPAVSLTIVAFDTPSTAPGNFTARQTGVGQATLAWDTVTSPLPVKGYEYTQDGDSVDPSWTAIADGDSTTVSHTVTDLADGSAHTFAVRAVNNAGGGPASAPTVSVTVEAQALAPANFSVDTGEGVVRLEWDASTDSTITGYEYVQLREVIKLTPDSGTNSDSDKEFGVSVAMDGDILVVGASRENFTDTNDITINNAGAAYIYTRVANEWTRVGKLTASRPVDGARFGESVAVDGDTVVVGALQDDLFNDDDTLRIDKSGAAYVFTKPPAGWADINETAKLIAGDAAEDDDFGNSVAIDGETIVVGAPETGVRVGSVYVFVEPGTGWADGTQTAKLATGDEKDKAGTSVAVYEDTIVVGAPHDDSARGEALVFIKPLGGWDNTTSRQARLRHSGSAISEFFGNSVAIDGNTIVVGAYGDGDPHQAGSAFVFVKSETGWDRSARLRAPSRAIEDRFGRSVAIDGDTVVVGSRQDDGNGDDSGSAFVYTKPATGWTNTSTPTTHRTAYDREAGDNFGQSVAVGSGVIAVGAWKHASRAGAAYVFTSVTESDWTSIDGSGQDATSHLLTGLPNDVAYTFRVRAVNAAGAGFSSVPIVATSKLSEPEPPTDLSVEQTGVGAVILRWKVSPSDLRVDGYQYTQNYAQNGEVVWADVPNSNSTTTSHTVAGLAAGESYTFAVRAVNRDFQSDPSMQDFTVASRPAAPGNFKVDADYEQVTLTWEAPSDDSGVTGYELMQLVEQIELTASDGADFDRFGVSVAVNGDTAVIGAYHHGETGLIFAGAAYVYTRDSVTDVWSWEAKLTASDANAGDEFGISVAVDGDNVVIGARSAATSTGAVYVFTKPAGGWANITETHKLIASDGEQGDRFGGSVAIDGATIVIGATGAKNTVSDAEVPTGSTYVFTRTNSGSWVQKAKLTAPDRAENDEFGGSVDIDDDTIAVGASRHDGSDDLTDSGVAYVYSMQAGVWATTTDSVRLTPSAHVAGGRFGNSVSVDGETIVVGVSGARESADADPTGAAYVFIRPADGWVDGNEINQTAKLTASDGGSGDQFGRSARVDGDTIVVGAHGNNNQGSIYLFTKPIDGWVDTTDAVKLAAFDGMNDDRFGIQVALDGDTALATAPRRDSNGKEQSGSTYVIDISKWADITGSNSTTDTHTVTQLASDVPFTFAVRAVNISGAGTPSSDGPVLAIANSPPSFTDGASVTLTVEENTAEGDDVGSPVSATDPDGDDTLTYTLSGTEAFVIDTSSGQISVGEGTKLDYEPRPLSYTFVVSVTDGKGPDGNATTTIDDTIEVTVEVINVEEAGEAFLFSASGLPIVNSTTTASLNDPDGFVPEEVSWRWATSTDQVNWNDIAGATSTDYVPSTDDVGYYLRATASYIDGFGSSTETESAVAEWPVAVEGTVFGTPYFASATTTRAVDENAASGTPVGAAVTATDRNGDVLDYKLTGTDEASFSIDASSGQISVGDETTLDYETRKSYSVVVTADDGQVSASIQVTINVNNVNEPGSITLLPPRPQENSTSTASLNDQDVMDPAIFWQWATSTDKAMWNDITGATSTDYMPSAYDVDYYLSVTATYNDGFGTTTVTAIYSSKVLDQDEDVSAPYFAANVHTSFEIPENASPGTVVGSVAAKDDDSGTLTYTLSGIDPSPFPFEIDADGQITVGAELDYERTSSYIVVVTADDGQAIASIQVTISVTNVDEVGEITLTSDQPKENTELTASLSDPDSVAQQSISWQWAKSASRSGPWINIGSNSDSVTYTPTTMDVGYYLRATASYTDGHGPNKSTSAVTANAVGAVNSAPSFDFDGPAELTVPEDSSGGTFVGSVTAMDDDDDKLTYSLSGAHASSFNINGTTGRISVAPGVTFNFESGLTTYNVTVSVKDNKDEEGNRAPNEPSDASIEVTIRVTNVEEDGRVTLSPDQPRENTELTASLTDPDGSVSGISWQWAWSADGSDPWTDIEGASSGSYTPTAADVDRYLRATASYTDGHGEGKSASAVSANTVAAKDPVDVPTTTPRRSQDPEPTPTPVIITVVPEEDIVPVPTVRPATQSVHLIDPSVVSEISSPDGAVSLIFPKESRQRTYQVTIDTSPEGCAGGARQLTGILLACPTVKLYSAEGEQETQVRLIKAATGSIRLTPEQVEELGGLAVLNQVYASGGISVYKRDSESEPWSPLRFELGITDDGGAEFRILAIRDFSTFALTVDEAILAQARAPAVSQVTPAVSPTPLPTVVAPVPTPLPVQDVEVGDAAAPPGLLLALGFAGLLLVIAGSRAVRNRRLSVPR